MVNWQSGICFTIRTAICSHVRIAIGGMNPQRKRQKLRRAVVVSDVSQLQNGVSTATEAKDSSAVIGGIGAGKRGILVQQHQRL
ncbi:hypothetical protein SUGI_0249000 [Cryptomeria japonica]|nr:hypothetical protein SUGI_0249000 [Cryptomeria japonica]